MRLYSHKIPATDDFAFRVLVLEDGDWRVAVWGSTDDPDVIEQVAEEAARDLVFRLPIIDDPSDEAVATRLALFAPSIVDELNREQVGRLLREMKTITERSVREALATAHSSIDATVKYEVGKMMVKAVVVETMAWLGFVGVLVGLWVAS